MKLKNGQGDEARDLADRYGRNAYLFEMTEESLDYRTLLQ